MGLYERLPYANFHEINLDYLIKRMTALEALVQNLPDDIKAAVYEWLDDHPWITVAPDSVFTEAIQDLAVTTDKLADGAVTEEKLAPYLQRDYVTPQDFGAIGDGNPAHSREDTEGFKAALASGKDIYVPTGNGEIYYIDETLEIPAAMNGKPATRKIFGFGDWRTVGVYGSIRLKIPYAQVDPDKGDEPIYTADDLAFTMFKMGQGLQGLHIANLRFTSYAWRNVWNEQQQAWTKSFINAGTMLDAYTSSTVDKDIEMVNVSITDYTLAVKMRGRGLVCRNCTFSSNTNFCTIDWDYGSASDPSPDNYGSRAMWLDGCRLHNNTQININVLSGHAYGLKINGCNLDHGGRTLIRCAEEAINWDISGNTFEESIASGSTLYMIDLRGGASNCNISGNVFQGGGKAAVRCNSGTLIGCSISNNTCAGTMNALLHLDGGSLEGCAINGNTMNGGHMIRMQTAGPTTGVSFAGNVLATVDPSYHLLLVNANTTGTMSKWSVQGNVSANATLYGGLGSGESAPIVNSIVANNVTSST